MKEDFLHYIWQNKLFTNKVYPSSTGESVEIIDTGIPNSDAGPDFFNAKIKTGSAVWAGNAEIHLKSSDWNSHKHYTDKAYDNVILHVVISNDEQCFNTRAKPVPTIQIEFPGHYYENYSQMLQNKTWIGCENKINKVDPALISMWIETLGVERVQSKTEYINEILSANNNNWEESFYQVLARSFGFGVNSDPFELLAKSVPLKILAKHKNSLNDIEAILFGQSGLLEMNEIKEDYTEKLNRDYLHLKNKYNLNPVPGFLWKFLRLRPGNFPTIRISQFATLIHRSSHLFSKILEADNTEQLISLFITSASEYWDNHYHFRSESKTKIKALGNESIKTILINAVVPFLYQYGDKTCKDYLKARSLNFLNELPIEKNNIIQKWKSIGLAPINSFEAQALLHLKKEYCNKRKCLQCKIGNSIITKTRCNFDSYNV